MRHSHHRRDERGSVDRDSFFHGLLHAIGRHHHGRGGLSARHGHHGFGGHDGIPRGRMVSSDDLQLLLLALLASEPRHGYELIKALEIHSNGFYSPSPGMIYPALTYLEELGYVTVELDGNRKRYAVAAEGRTYLESNRERADAILTRLGEIGRKMDSVRRAFAGEESGEEADGEGWVPELAKMRWSLKRVFHELHGAAPERQREIAAILQRALDEIVAGTKGRVR